MSATPPDSTHRIGTALFPGYQIALVARIGVERALFSLRRQQRALAKPMAPQYSLCRFILKGHKVAERFLRRRQLRSLA